MKFYKIWKTRVY